MTEEITDRIRQLMQEYSLSPSAFADEIGIQRPAISHILSGRNRPSLDVVMKILKAFAQINPQWLLTGEGTMKQLNLFEESPEETNKTTDIENVKNKKALESRVENHAVPSSDTAHSQHVYSQQAAITAPIPPKSPPVTELPQKEHDIRSVSQTSSSQSSYHNSPSAVQEPVQNYSTTQPHAHYEYPHHEQQYRHRHVQYEQPIPPQSVQSTKSKEPVKESNIADAILGNSGGKKIERIVMFFADKTFTVYTPE